MRGEGEQGVFKVSDQVLVETKNTKLKNLSCNVRSLADQYVSSYEIIAVKPGNAYKLRLLSHSQAFCTFHASKLQLLQIRSALSLIDCSGPQVY